MSPASASLSAAPPVSLRILVVENHDDTRKYLAMYLEQLGHAVETVATMQAALAAAPESDCQVLISDIGLPDGDGWELLKKAGFSHPVFAIAMSGFGMNADREKSRAAGYRHHLLKPFDLVALDEMLDEAAAEIAAR